MRTVLARTFLSAAEHYQPRIAARASRPPHRLEFAGRLHAGRARSTSVFPACGRRRGGSTSAANDTMAALPRGEGVDVLLAQSCAALGACSRCVIPPPRARSTPPVPSPRTVVGPSI